MAASSLYKKEACGIYGRRRREKEKCFLREKCIFLGFIYEIQSFTIRLYIYLKWRCNFNLSPPRVAFFPGKLFRANATSHSSPREVRHLFCRRRNKNVALSSRTGHPWRMLSVYDDRYIIALTEKLRRVSDKIARILPFLDRRPFSDVTLRN